MDASPQSSTNTPKSRYTSIIISVIIFLILISGILVTSIYNSLKILDLRAAVSLSTNLRSDIQTLTQDIYLLNTMRSGQQPASVTQPQAIKVAKSTQEIDEKITVLKQGGDVKIGGDQVAYETLTKSEQIKFVEETSNLWAPYKDQAIKFVSSPIVVSSSFLKQSFGKPTEGIYDNVTGLTNNLNSENGKRAGFLRNIQTFGISFAILYFIIFVLYFVRRLKASDAELRAARRETQEIMQTVNTGLFLLDKDLSIGQQHSKALTTIIGTPSLAGENFTNVLRGRISDTDLNTTQQFIEQLYNPRVKEKLVDALNPLHKVMLHNASNEKGANSRFLDFKFSRVYEGKSIARILVNVNDVSDAVYLEQRLEKERSQNDMQIEMLTTILNVEPTIINEFISNTKLYIEKMNSILKNPGSSQYELENKLKAIYRDMHSLKGESSALKLHGFTKISSEAEDKLQALQNQSELAGNDFLALAIHLDELLMLSETIETLGQRINRELPTSATSSKNSSVISSDSSGISSDNSRAGSVVTLNATKPADDIVETMPLVAVTNDLDEADLESGIDIDLDDEPNRHLLSYYQDFAQDIAVRQDKQVQLNSETLAKTVIPEHLRTSIKEISVQLLRNAVVHGIEAPAARQLEGKPTIGIIDIEVKNEGQDFIITLQDDGQGIDYDSIRHKLVAMNRYSVEQASNLNRTDLLKQLFSSGFSTKDDADEDGGRGVGLDIIKAQVKEHAGKLNVKSELGKMTRFVITLPAA